MDKKINTKEIIENNGYMLHKINKNETIKEIEENENLDLEYDDDFTLNDLNKEQLIEVINDLIDKRMLNTGNVEGISMDEKSFEKGVAEGSFYAGIFQALVSSGMEMEEAYNITLNISTSKGNLETAKANYINTESQNI